VSATIRALSRLLDASYLDEAPTDEQRDAWREDVANARDEYDRLRALLREAAEEVEHYSRERGELLAARDRHAADVGHAPDCCLCGFVADEGAP
jgi:hypothetical protein